MKSCWLAMIAIIGLAACASPQEQAFKPAVPAPFDWQQDQLKGADAAPMPLHRWMPKAEPKAIIIALHGFNDYGNAFALSGEAFQSQGIGVIAYDQRGFGATAQRGIWAGHKNLTRDLRHMIAATRARYPHVPLYVLGESMGGAVAMVTCAHGGCDGLNGLILSAPAVWGDDTMNVLYRLPLWVMAHLFPSSEFTGEDVKIQASDNIPMLIAMGKDPLIIKKTRVDAIYGLVHLMDDAYRTASEIDLPILLLYGQRDQVIPRKPIEHTINHLKAPHRAKLYPKGYHMLLRDLGRKAVIDDVVEWIKDPSPVTSHQVSELSGN